MSFSLALERSDEVRLSEAIRLDRDGGAAACRASLPPEICTRAQEIRRRVNRPDGIAGEPSKEKL